MKTYEIIYHLRPDNNDVIIDFMAKNEEDAIAFAKQYRSESFSISEIEAEENHKKD